MKSIHIMLASLMLMSAIALKNSQSAVLVSPIVQSPRLTAAVSQTLARRSMSLEKRYANTWVNEVFKKNIMLTLLYLNKDVSGSQAINWNTVTKPSHIEFTLKPSEVFAFHDTVLPEYQGKVVRTTGARFNAADGFLSSGSLFGDGVCHLASLINWAAIEAGLEVKAPTNHDFANIPQVPREFGVSIYITPDSFQTSAVQNLYIRNNRTRPVTMTFHFDGENLEVAVKQIS